MNDEEPLMYSQFCYYIQKNEEKRKATMHIPRNPGEQIEVDGAGDSAYIIAPDPGEVIEVWIFVGVLIYSQYTFVETFTNLIFPKAIIHPLNLPSAFTYHIKQFISSFCHGIFFQHSLLSIT